MQFRSLRHLTFGTHSQCGTPAAQSHKYAIAAQQIVQNNIALNAPNYATAGGHGTLPVPSMDPTRPQSDDPAAVDPSIRFLDLATAEKPVPFHASCNVELVKKRSPAMVSALKRARP